MRTAEEYEINWADVAADEMAFAANQTAARERADKLVDELRGEVQFLARMAAGLTLVLCVGLLALSSCAAHPTLEQQLYQAVCVDEGACK